MHFSSDAPDDWDARQTKNGASFLQSSQWAGFQRQLGHEVYFISRAGWSCLLVERRTPFGTYLFAPYGPTLNSKKDLIAAVKELKVLGKRTRRDWLIIEPMLSGAENASLREPLVKLGARQSSHLREPDLTRIIDLSLSEEGLLASISQSTRSYIRKNQREKFLTFKSSSDPKDIDYFIKMLAMVSDRNKISFFPDSYFRLQAGLLMPPGMLHLEMAYHNGSPVASALIHDYGQSSFYTYAASLPEARRTSASALLLWQCLLNAKQRGQIRMDLFGIAPDDASPSHPWHGFSSFKKKFGGQVVAYAGAWDLPLSRKYHLYRAAQRARRLTR